jgi:ribose transport system permease protein
MWQRFLRKNPYLFALLLLVVLIAINANLQSNFFSLRAINGNFRVLLPLMILAVGQSIVIIGGGIDLSVGAIVSLVNVILVTRISPESGVLGVSLAILLGCVSGMLAGALNGVCVALLRLQPIVTTYATSFIFAGLALLILPRPGGQLPRAMTRFYRSTPLNIPVAVYVIIVLLLLWALVRGSRYGQYLFATGSRADAAYTTGIPVLRVKFASYVVAGLFAALAALALTLGIGSGNARIGDAMTLESIVAVVLGGTRLRGGQGGVAGAIIGVAILGIIRNLISFADVPTWYQTLVNASIIVLALAGPGAWRLISQQVGKQRKLQRRRPA